MALVLLLTLSSVILISGRIYGVGNVCDLGRRPNERPHSVKITDFGAVGDGETLNTLAFQNAVFYLKSFADKGGAQLYVPPGRWLTGSFNLTSHLTLFLEKDAVILASQVCVCVYVYLSLSKVLIILKSKDQCLHLNCFIELLISFRDSCLFPDGFESKVYSCGMDSICENSNLV